MLFLNHYENPHLQYNKLSLFHQEIFQKIHMKNQVYVSFDEILNIEGIYLNYDI